jgi:enoyl-CoA hydratase
MDLLHDARPRRVDPRRHEGRRIGRGREVHHDGRAVGAPACRSRHLAVRREADRAHAAADARHLLAVRARRLKSFAAYDALERLPMPAIAVVAGPAVGSGVEIAAACDFIIATPAASFRTPEALWGTVGATQRLPRIIGKRLAKDLMFTGRALGAEEAREAGLVARVVAPDALAACLAEITATILKAPPAAMALAKRCVDEGLERDPRGALATEILAIEESLAAAEWRKKMQDFA